MPDEGRVRPNSPAVRSAEPGRVPSPPTHDGPCVESVDGDGEALGYCVTCYQPVEGRVPSCALCGRIGPLRDLSGGELVCVDSETCVNTVIESARDGS